MGIRLCCFLILFAINVAFVKGQCAQYQKKLLLELKNNLTYDSSYSTKLVQWDESIDCCRWNGVKCDLRGRVIGLDLGNESISDGIGGNDSSLFKLEFLQSLSLALNFWSYASLPSGFGRLSGLSYLNLSNSGFAGQVPADFSDLSRLVVLDLSTSYATLSIENPDLNALIHNFTVLRELYMDYVNISVNGYQWCNAVSSLSNLRVLSLSNTYITGPFDPSLAKLRSLSVIRLDGNTFSSPIPAFLADFPSLRVLSLKGCNLSGVTPPELFEISSLQTIDLTGNELLEGSLSEFPLNGLLQNLVLSGTNFSGNVPESITNLKMLSVVDFRGCRFSGSILNSLRNLTQLTYLDLSGNQFTGNVPSFSFLKNLTFIYLAGNGLTGRIPDSLWEGLESLEFLDLSQNALEGEIPVSLFVLPLLENLDLSNNSFNGSIRDLTDTSYSLGGLDLSMNSLVGPVPKFLFELRNLSSLSLMRNKFSGFVDFTDFQKLSSLVSLELSYNNLSVYVNENVSMSLFFPRLNNLALASCKLQKFPLLKNQSSIMMLDLSDNLLSGEVPNWIWEVGNGGLRMLNLSHNQLTSLQEPYDLRSLAFLDLHSNMIGGQIPLPPPSAALVDFSNNNFSSFIPEDIGNYLERVFFFSVANNNIRGTIPLSLCNASRIEVLDMSNNSLHGIIPSCLVPETLRVLNLRRNNLTGDIPDTFPVTCGLETLDLSWNGLQGQVPISLPRCTNIEVLNIGNNNINDSFPCSFKNLSGLRVLELHSNAFNGNISCLQEGNVTWSNLQIINLASNDFNGVLPENLFRNMKAMLADVNGTQSQLDHLHFTSVIVNQVYYQDSLTVTLRGQEHDLNKILTVFTVIDFSNNHFEGVIPETIFELKSLYVLNFSQNALSGHIPSSVGELQTLGSLDLSFNNLDGEIPQQLASLTFLSFLNLSYNDFVGGIPQGNQMNTFSESSFAGNEGLCGFPLNVSCRSQVVPQTNSVEGQDSLVGGSDVYISAALGFLVGIGVIFMPLLYSKRWSKFYNKHVNKFVLLVLHQQDRRKANEDW